MRALIISLFVLIGGIFVFSPSVSAVNVFSNTCGGPNSVGSSDICTNINSQPSGVNPILKILKIVINVLSYIIGVASVIVLIIAGIQMVTGGGDAQGVKNARSMMIYALIGIVIAALAQLIVLFVLNSVGNA